MRALLTLFVLLPLAVSLGCSVPPDPPMTQPAEEVGVVGPVEVGAAVAELSNGDVTWHGTFAGLMPRITGEPARRLAEAGEEATPALVAALADADKFAAAHVVLTQIHVREMQLSGSHWNGLRVTLTADDLTLLYPEQREELREHWQRRLAEPAASETPAVHSLGTGLSSGVE